MVEKSEIHAKSMLLISAVRLTTATIFNLDDHTGMVKSWHRSCMIACCPPHHGSRSRWRHCSSEWLGILHWEERSKNFICMVAKKGRGVYVYNRFYLREKKLFVHSFGRSFVFRVYRRESWKKSRFIGVGVCISTKSCKKEIGVA